MGDACRDPRVPIGGVRRESHPTLRNRIDPSDTPATLGVGVATFKCSLNSPQPFSTAGASAPRDADIGRLRVATACWTTAPQVFSGGDDTVGCATAPTRGSARRSVATPISARCARVVGRSCRPRMSAPRACRCRRRRGGCHPLPSSTSAPICSRPNPTPRGWDNASPERGRRVQDADRPPVRQRPDARRDRTARRRGGGARRPIESLPHGAGHAARGARGDVHGDARRAESIPR